MLLGAGRAGRGSGDNGKVEKPRKWGGKVDLTEACRLRALADTRRVIIEFVVHVHVGRIRGIGNNRRPGKRGVGGWEQQETRKAGGSRFTGRVIKADFLFWLLAHEFGFTSPDLHRPVCVHIFNACQFRQWRACTVQARTLSAWISASITRSLTHLQIHIYYY